MTTQQERSQFRRAILVLLGAAAIALGAQLSVPMVPVPTTLQTLAVVLVGLRLGPLAAMASAAVYFLGVLAGFPILSSGQEAGGRAFTQFLAAGYVVAFIPGAGLAGWLGYGKGFLRRFGAGLASHGLVLLLGAAGLGLHIGYSAALEGGVLPFLIGAVVKSLVAAAITGWVRKPESG